MQTRPFTPRSMNYFCLIAALALFSFLIFGCMSDGSISWIDDSSAGGAPEAGTPGAPGSAATSMGGHNTIDWNSFSEGAEVRAFIPTGHTNIVKSLVYSPDGRYIVSKSTDVKLWNAETGSLLRTFPHSFETISHSIAFSSKGEYLLGVGGHGDGLQIWQTATGTMQFRLQNGNSDFTCAAYSPDDSMIAAGASGSVTVWDAEDHRILARLEGFRHDITHIVFSPDGKKLITSGADNFIRIWNTDGWESIREIETGRALTDLTISPDGRYLAGAVADSIITWKTDSGKRQDELKDGLEEVKALRFSPDGRYLTSVQADNVIKIRAFPSGKLMETLDLPLALSSDGYSLAYSPEGSRLACGQFKRISIWDMNTKTLERILEEKNKTDGWSAENVLYQEATANLFLNTGNEMRVWNLPSGSINRWNYEHLQGIRSFSFSPDQRLIALTRSDRTLIIIDTATGSLLRRFEQAVDPSVLPVFSPGGTYIAAKSADGQALLWNYRTRELLHSFRIGKGHLKYLGFNRDDSMLFGGTAVPWDGISYRWDIRSGEQLRDIRGQYIGSTPESGNVLLVSHRNRFEIYNSSVDTQKTGFDLPNKRLLHSSFSPDGTYLAAVFADGTLRLWDLKKMIPLEYLNDERHGSITCTSFLTDRHLLLMFEDGVIQFVNTRSGEKLELVRTVTEEWQKEKQKEKEIWQRYYIDSWFASDDLGHFDTDSEAYRKVQFVRGMEVYDAEQFWDSFFTPGLIASFLGLSPETAPTVDTVNPAPAAPPVKIAEAFNNVPTVTISSQTPEDQPEVLRVTVTAKPRDNGVGELFLLHNGRRIDEKTRGLEIVSETTDSKIFLIPLLAGLNELQGGAYDRDHTVYGTSDVLHISYDPPRVTPPNMYILAVGVGNYRDTALNLTFPDEDAEAVASLFQDKARGLYRTVQTNILKNGAADRQHIIDGLDLFMKKAESRDTVILFFAGHGYVEDGIYYFLPSDTDITDLEGSAIPISILEDFLREIPANKIAVFFDTCQSGSAVKSLGTVAMSRSVEERRLIANLAKARGIAVFSASSAAQSAYEIPELHHGIFTYGILNAFNNRIDQISEDGRISLGKLLSTVNGITRETAYRYLKIEQSPAVYQFGDDFQIGQVQ